MKRLPADPPPFLRANVPIPKRPHAHPGPSGRILSLLIWLVVETRSWPPPVNLSKASPDHLKVHTLTVDIDDTEDTFISVCAVGDDVDVFVQDKAGKILCGCLAEGLAGLMLASGLLWGIDADKPDGMLLTIGYHGDCVPVGDTGALELAGKDDDRKDENAVSAMTLRVLVVIRKPSTLCYR